MRVQNIDMHFQGLAYHKTSEEILTKAKAKITQLNAKIEERQKRIADLRKEHGIDDAALVQLLTAARKNQNALNYSYKTSMGNAGIKGMDEERTIGAGLVNNLLTENDFVEGEKDQVAKLSLIVRNLRPVARFGNGGMAYTDDSFPMSNEDLTYLGF